MSVDCDSFFDDYGCVFTMCHGYQSPFPVVRLGAPHREFSHPLRDKEVTAITLARGAKQGTLRRLLALDFGRKDNCMCFLNLLSTRCKPIPLDEEALLYTRVASYDNVYAYSAHIREAASAAAAAAAVSSFSVLYHNPLGGGGGAVTKCLLPHTSCAAPSHGQVWCLPSCTAAPACNPAYRTNVYNHTLDRDDSHLATQHAHTSLCTITHGSDALSPPRLACFDLESMFTRGGACEPLWSIALTASNNSSHASHTRCAHDTGNVQHDRTECSPAVITAGAAANPHTAAVLEHDAVYHVDTRQRAVSQTVTLHTAPLLRGALSGEHYVIYYAADGTLRVLDVRRPGEPLLRAWHAHGMDVKARCDDEVALLITAEQVMVMHVPSLRVVAAQPFSEGSALDAVVLSTTANSVELCSSSAGGMLYHMNIRY